MTPIKIVFVSDEHLTVYSDDPSAFSASVHNANPPEIKEIEYLNEADKTPELTEVKLTLRSGAVVRCCLAKEDMPRAQFIREIVDCDTSDTITYANLARQEHDLDTRFSAVSAIINNIPDLDTRLYLHKEYMKRKQAYISAVEALVDGVFRRHND